MNQPLQFFPTSKKKLIVMSICTFSIYVLYWFYKNWKNMEATQGLPFQPFRRMLCAPIFCYDLFKRVQRHAEENDIHTEFSPGWLAITFVFLIITLVLPFPFSLMAFFLPVFSLLSVQGVINAINTKMASGLEINCRFSVWNITAIVFGALLWILLILGIIVQMQHA